LSSSLMCAFLILSVLFFPIISLKNFISIACILLSCLLVHVCVSVPFKRMFLKHTLYMVVSHFLCVSIP
jgi:hypothetical protein